MNLSHWIAAARLRTLPLAFSSILLGTFLAAAQGHFNGWILMLSLITTLCYQVLSNYANDYGDGVKGTDSNRDGEARAVASGLISAAQMKKAVILFAILSLIFGTGLSFLATQSLSIWVGAGFGFLGLLAVIAAITYTVGKRAYGYNALGDLAVLIFFGWIGVVGSHFLQTATFDWHVFLPATSVGFLAMGVLNLNNMRDLDKDKSNGKITLAVKLGLRGAKIYHGALLLLAFDAAFLFNTLKGNGLMANLYFLAVPFLVINLTSVYKAFEPLQFEPLLKRLALTTLLFSLLFGLGQLL